jgi:hypothetical protein
MTFLSERFPITGSFPLIRYKPPRVNRHARPALVAITHGYRYLEDVQNRWFVIFRIKWIQALFW